MAVHVMGANALAAEPETVGREAESSRVTLRRAPEMPKSASKGKTPAQPSLFGAELQPKLIPFESGRSSGAPAHAEPGVSHSGVTPISGPAETKAAVKTATRRSVPADDPQTTLDFLPPLKTAQRTLKTNANAVIFCEAVVAGPIHRTTAAALDLAMIGIAFSSVLVLFQFVGQPASLDRLTIAALGAMFAVMTLFYGLLFAIAGTVTPGMHWTHLRLISFDGFALDGRTRALRVAGSWISVLSGGIGLLWALLDEENLTWHDHISKTFPTLRESDCNVVCQPRR